MKILLIGEYSNVHWTLAEGLRRLGHKVTVVSNGDFWKDYRRDISLVRRHGRTGGLRFLGRLALTLPKLRGYDIVQIINPMFVELKAERIFHIYDFLRRHNRKMVLGGFGMDYYWVNTCCENKPLLYSDFNIGSELRTNADALKEKADWLGTAKERLNKYIAADCDHIITGLYEYQVCYERHFPKKTSFIPFPIVCKPNVMEQAQHEADNHEEQQRPTRIFIGINRTRSEYKGTDIMLKAAEDVQRKHPERMKLVVAESVPFSEYCKMMDGSDAIMDQLYSYTPAMNALEAMSKGIICIGGGEEANYDILGEQTLRPIINVRPTYESVYSETERLIMHPERIAQLKKESLEYIAKHHDYVKVARKYEEIYKRILYE